MDDIWKNISCYCQGRRNQGGHGPHTIFKSMFWPPHFWGRLAQVEPISQERINVLMIKTKYTLQAYRGLDTGVPCADGSVQEPWQDLH